MLYMVWNSKIAHDMMSKVPEKVLDELIRGRAFVDDQYGKDRDYLHNDGGYAVVAETKADFEELKKKFFDYENATPEYGIEIKLTEKEKESGEYGEYSYTSVVFILNNEFVVEIFSPKNITPEFMLEVVE